MIEKEYKDCLTEYGAPSCWPRCRAGSGRENTITGERLQIGHINECYQAKKEGTWAGLPAGWEKEPIIIPHSDTSVKTAGFGGGKILPLLIILGASILLLKE